jgi:signal peptidase I
VILKIRKFIRLPFKRRKKSPPKETKKRSFIYEIGEVLVVAFILSLMVRMFLIQAYYIPTRSMENTLLVNDMLLAEKISYKFFQPKRGDIIIFSNPDIEEAKSGKKFMAKRVIGLPGESISIKSGEVYINDKKLYEPYIKEKCNLDVILYDRNIKNNSGIVEFHKLTTGEITIPKNHYFVMGDNRNNSKDSRFFGPVDRKLIIAKPLIIYWPPKRIGMIH